MGRSKESSRRKRSAESKDFGYYAKRHARNTAYTVNNFPSEENATQSTVYGSTQSFCDVTTYAQIPYYSWTTYFFNQEYNENSLTVSKINAFIDFFERNTWQPEETSNIQTDLNLDINLCLADSALLQKWPSLMEDLKISPQQTFNCMRVAIFEVTLRRLTPLKILTFTKLFRILRLNRINIINHESINALSQFNLSAYGKLISISGIVINTSSPKRSSVFVVLACTCKREIIAEERHGTYFVPKRCKVCGNGKFKRLLDSIHQFTKIEQTIEIKHYPSTHQKTEVDTRSSNIISVKLASSMIDNFVPGDKIKVIGIPRIILGAVKSTTSGSCPLYIDAISTFGADDEIYRLVEGNSTDTPFNRNLIEEIQSVPDLLSLLVKSLCPTVYGHEIIKAALILELFSGGFGCGATRNFLHTLIIGDLGLGKTQLLDACAQIAQKRVHVGENSMNPLEPTIINVRKDGIQESRLEAGAFAWASGSLYCIDELHKISAQHHSIYTCMENRTVNITNSEIKLDLEAETAIVGMIKPIKMHYDPSKTVVENVNACQEFLSRFDMVFVMRDNQDTYRDKLMCDQMLAAHTKRQQLTERKQFSRSALMSDSPARESRTLIERLETPDESRIDILPQELFQMYTNYARIYVNPQISTDSKKFIQFVCSLRYQKHKNSVNIERFVRTLVLLSQARARLALHAEVTEADINDALEILEHALLIETKNRSGDRPLASSNNSNKLTANKVNQFLNELKTESALLGKTTFTKNELENVAGKENLTGYTFSNLISRLNEQGYLLKVSTNMYKLVSK